MVEIIENGVKVPAPIVELTHKLLDDSQACTQVEFCWTDDDLNHHAGAYLPEQKMIVISLFSAFVFNDLFMKRGFNMLSSIWTSLLFNLIRLSLQARRVDKNPELAKLDAPTEEMEIEVNATAWKWMMVWYKKFSIPKFLDDWGTIGDNLKQFEDDSFEGSREFAVEKYMLYNGMATDVEMLLQKKIITLDEARQLDTDINEVKMGKVISNRACLSPYELMVLITDEADQPKKTQEELKAEAPTPPLSPGQKKNLLIHIHNVLHEMPRNTGILDPDACHINQVWKPWVKRASFRGFIYNTVPACDVVIDDGVKEIRLRLIAQNPQKRNANGDFSFFAIKAQQGDKITHVFGNGEAEYIGRVHNGVFHRPKDNLYEKKGVVPKPRVMVAGMEGDTPPPYVDPNQIDEFVQGAC